VACPSDFARQTERSVGSHGRRRATYPRALTWSVIVLAVDWLTSSILLVCYTAVLWARGTLRPEQRGVRASGDGRDSWELIQFRHQRKFPPALPCRHRRRGHPSP
jgi:hypothetical protein